MRTIKNKGFTIIELMIAVAIIGILAAIAVPAYQSYTIRARVSEAMTFAGSAKTSVTEYYQVNGTFPMGMTNTTVGLPAAASLSGTNTASITVSQVSANVATIVAVTSISGVSGMTITLTGTGNSSGMTWTCTSNSPQSVPSSCR